MDNIPKHVQSLLIAVIRCISIVGQLPPPGEYPNTSLQIPAVTATRGISNSLNYCLPVHHRTHPIIASKFINNWAQSQPPCVFLSLLNNCLQIALLTFLNYVLQVHRYVLVNDICRCPSIYIQALPAAGPQGCVLVDPYRHVHTYKKIHLLTQFNNKQQ